MTPDQEQRFSEAYFRYLQDRLRTPRAIKRYFGQAGATLGSLAGEVDIVDFLVVTFLRTSEPGVYRMLGRHRAELTGTSIDPALHRDSRPGERAERWKQRLRQTGVAPDNIDGMLGLLGLLFPAVQQAVGNGGDPRAAARRRGIGNQDYFDRYIVFTVPEDDLPEAVFQLALAQLASRAEGDEAAQLLLRLREDTHRIVRRIDQLRADGIPVPAAALLQAMADNYGQLTAQPEATGLLGADRRVRSFTPSLLLDLSPEERPPVVAAMATTPDGVVLATRTLHSATNPDDTASEHTTTTEPWAAQARDALTGRLTGHLTPAAVRPAPDLTDQDSTLIWMWRHTDPAGIRTWLHDRLDHGWELLPLLAALITPQQFPFPLIDNDTWAGLDAQRSPRCRPAHCDPRSPRRATATPMMALTVLTASWLRSSVAPESDRHVGRVAGLLQELQVAILDHPGERPPPGPLRCPGDRLDVAILGHPPQGRPPLPYGWGRGASRRSCDPRSSRRAYRHPTC
ncbi:hypothetical protein ACWDU8_13025 [Streptomyces sp. NPDC003388]